MARRSAPEFRTRLYVNMADYVMVICSELCSTIVFFRPFFIWERKIVKSNVFFTKFAKHEIYIHRKWRYPKNSSHVNLTSCDMYL